MLQVTAEIGRHIKVTEKALRQSKSLTKSGKTSIEGNCATKGGLMGNGRKQEGPSSVPLPVSSYDALPQT